MMDEFVPEPVAKAVPFGITPILPRGLHELSG
jgi:hypothetical protein